MGGDASALLLLGIMLHPCLSQDIQPTCCPDIIYTNGERTCCRAEDCSSCREITGREVLNNVTVQREISITLEATPSGKLCPSPNLQDPEGVLCTRICSTSTTMHDFVFHSVATSNVPYDKEECPDCCLPNFASETMSCSRDCNMADVKCFVCSSDSPVSTRGQQCAGYLDSSCSLQGAAGIFSGKCVGQACSRYKFLLSWNLFESFQIRILAPATFMYTWKPTTSGILVLHYRVLLGPDRFACCPYGMDTCCPSSTGASLGYVSTRLCNGPSSCNDGSTCSAKCSCPSADAQTGLIASQSQTASGDQACWVAAGQEDGDLCFMYKILYEINADMVQFHSMTGFGEGLKTLSDIQKIFAGQDVNTRSNIPGRHEVKLTSEGLVLDVELASPVTAGQTYTLEGVTFNIFNPTTSKMSMACSGSSTALLNPTSMTLRSYILSSTGEPSTMSLIPSCMAQSSCEACLAFGFNGLVCEWNPMSRQCVQKGTSSMLINITQCAASLPPLIGSKVAAKSFGPIIASFFIILTLVVAYVYNKRFANKQTAVIERESNLVQHAEMFEQQRHWDPRLVHPRPLVRGPKGEIDYQSEVMEKRLQNPKTPYHLMDADTVAKHHEMHGYVTETQLLS